MTTGVPERLSQALSDRYRIERELGAGGMATVYLAHDLKHDRDVAIKVLHQDLAAALGAERFLAEIKTTAKLQHPHILPLLDSGEAAGLLYYVMPYLKGESLRDRLTREKQLPIEDSVRIAREVADALGHAHGHEVIHRDIKPENILLQEGHALVADFGIALAVQSAGGQRMTQTGLSLGTPQYMSPEQAMGEKAIDARADIYALGAVTYEMLTGEPPFTGATVQAIVARVMNEEPRPITSVRKTVPAHVEAAVLKALAKLPADRWGAPAQFASALVSAGDVEGQRGSSSNQRRWATAAVLPWVALGLALLAFAILEVPRLWTPSNGRTGLRMSIVLPESTSLAVGDYARHVAITPDGNTVLFIGMKNGVSQVYSRRLEAFESQPVPGTEGAHDLVALDDNRAFVAVIGTSGQFLVKRFALDGSTAAVLTPTYGLLGASPTEGEVLLTTRDGQALMRIPTDGSAPAEVPLPPETFHLGASRLPGRADYVVSWTSLSGFFGAAALLRPGESARAITRRGPVPSDSVRPDEYIFGNDVRFEAPGFLRLTQYDGSIVRMAFDPRSGSVSGDPEVVFRDVRVEPYTWFAQYAVAANGTTVYAPGLNANAARFTWIGPGGRADTLPIPMHVPGSFRVSRDGRRLIAARLAVGQKAELVVYDLKSNVPPRRVPDQAPMPPAAFWPDAESFAYFGSNGYIVRRSATTLAAIDSVPGRGWGVEDVSPDGRSILVSVLGGGAGTGLWLVSWPDGKRSLVDADGTAATASFHPDGRRFAYAKVYSGEYHVFVRSVFGDTTAMRVGIGFGPAWSPDGSAIYANTERGTMHVARASGAGFSPMAQLAVPAFVDVSGRDVDVGPDGRLLIIAQVPQPPIRELRVIFGRK